MRSAALRPLEQHHVRLVSPRGSTSGRLSGDQAKLRGTASPEAAVRLNPERPSIGTRHMPPGPLKYIDSLAVGGGQAKSSSVPVALTSLDSEPPMYRMAEPSTSTTGADRGTWRGMLSDCADEVENREGLQPDTPMDYWPGACR